ncbi:hypothetical protein SCA6_009474 [Theobroma cacao]
MSFLRRSTVSFLGQLEPFSSHSHSFHQPPENSSSLPAPIVPPDLTPLTSLDPISKSPFTGTSNAGDNVTLNLDSNGPEGPGMSKNYSADACTRKSERSFDVYELSSVTWEEDPYAFSGILIYRHRIQESRRISDQRDSRFVEQVTLKLFTYEKLKHATNNFTDNIGRGSCGAGFKVAMCNGYRIVAIKRLEKVKIKDRVGGKNNYNTEYRQRNSPLARRLRNSDHPLC